MSRPWYLAGGRSVVDRLAALVASRVRSGAARLRASHAADRWRAVGESLAAARGRIPGWLRTAFRRLLIVAFAWWLARFAVLPAAGVAPAGGHWYAEFALWIFAVTAAGFFVHLGGWWPGRVLRAAWVAWCVAVLPLASFAGLAYVLWGFEAWSLRSWAYVEGAWRGGAAIEAPVAALFAGLHGVWLAWGLWLARRAPGLYQRLRPWWAVPLAAAVRLAVPATLAWLGVEWWMGGAGDLVAYAAGRLDLVLDRVPGARAWIDRLALPGEWLVYAAGAASGALVVALVWYAAELVSIVLTYQVELMASLRATGAAVGAEAARAQGQGPGADPGEGAPMEARVAALKAHTRERVRARLASEADAAEARLDRLRDEIERLEATSGRAEVAAAEAALAAGEIERTPLAAQGPPAERAPRMGAVGEGPDSAPGAPAPAAAAGEVSASAPSAEAPSPEGASAAAAGRARPRFAPARGSFRPAPVDPEDVTVDPDEDTETEDPDFEETYGPHMLQMRYDQLEQEGVPSAGDVTEEDIVADLVEVADDGSPEALEAQALRLAERSGVESDGDGAHGAGDALRAPDHGSPADPDPRGPDRVHAAPVSPEVGVAGGSGVGPAPEAEWVGSSEPPRERAPATDPYSPGRFGSILEQAVPPPAGRGAEASGDAPAGVSEDATAQVATGTGEVQDRPPGDEGAERRPAPPRAAPAWDQLVNELRPHESIAGDMFGFLGGCAPASSVRSALGALAGLSVEHDLAALRDAPISVRRELPHLSRFAQDGTFDVPGDEVARLLAARFDGGHRSLAGLGPLLLRALEVRGDDVAGKRMYSMSQVAASAAVRTVPWDLKG